jgi:hypothetical protein
MINALNIKKVVYGSFAVFVAVYISSSFLSPVDSEALAKYNVSELQLRLLSASFLLPVVAIWACAAYGFVHFKQYALSIKGSAYGKGTNTIANGLGLIAAQLMVSGSISTLSAFDAVKEALGGDSGISILSTGAALIFTLAAALVLYQGSSQLIASLSRPTKPKIFSKGFSLLVITGLVFLIAIVLRYPADGTTESVYEYISVGWAIIGIWIPSLVTWNFFLLAARNLHYYRHHVKGKVYKQALGLFSNGVYIILGSSVFVQLLGTFSKVFANLRLLPLLVIVYLLVFAIGIGYLFIARSAARLSKVET